jgi:hypothetical protein
MGIALTWKNDMNTIELEQEMLGLLHGKFSSINITYNDHSVNYMDAATAISDGSYGYVEWVSEDEKVLASEKNSVWVLQWYPNTPIGFCAVAASSFAVCLAHALKG